MKHLPHIILNNSPQTTSFTSPQQRGSRSHVPERDRRSHSEFLKRQLDQAWRDAEDEIAVYHLSRQGIYLEFKGEQGYDLITKSLENMGSKKVRLLNVRKEDNVTYATVFVANEKAQFFFKKLSDYAEKESKSGKPRHAKLINSIASLSKALLIESFWQDDKKLIPNEEPEWCEVWLSSDSIEIISQFEELLAQQGINAKEGFIRFPERAIKVIYASRYDLEQLSRLSDNIAEYRRAKETTSFWTNLTNKEQAEWVSHLLERISVDPISSVSVCILDTGVNNGHPLLSPILADDDCQTVKSEWGSHDHSKHGTLMAGIVGYGNLIKLLMDSGTIKLSHRLESVKILPIPPHQTEPDLWGLMTAEGISRAEIQSPNRKRLICMAVTTSDTRDRGRPSSWSGEIDQIVSGAEDDKRRLIIISAGNPEADTKDIAKQYPKIQCTDSIHDPAQSWNALTVGAYTALDTITDQTFSGFNPIAPKGGLSPFTTTSLLWEDIWPIKPEIVMEGGNLAIDADGFPSECNDLSLLSTSREPQTAHFDWFNMTSAATAQAAWFAAQIQSQYQDFWPETIRALMVHSAEWTETLKAQFLQNESKDSYKRLLRICGYGVPNLEQALYSAANSLTLIRQAELQPFKKENGRCKTNEMHLHELPWPKDVLLGLPPTTEVKMRITLSYFIEPGPGEIGWKDRYRYSSHALRFDLNAPSESKEDFIKRVNDEAKDEDEGHPGTKGPTKYWVIGPKARNKGSIHSDIWRGTAAELADSNLIAISPRIGWWRERSHLNKYERKTRYSLVVTIATPEESIDIYTPVANQIGIAIPVRSGV